MKINQRISILKRQNFNLHQIRQINQNQYTLVETNENQVKSIKLEFIKSDDQTYEFSERIFECSNLSSSFKKVIKLSSNNGPITDSSIQNTCEILLEYNDFGFKLLSLKGQLFMRILKGEPLDESNIIVFGKSTLKIKQNNGNIKITAIFEGNYQKSFNFGKEKERITIGRRADADIHINDVSVSRNQCSYIIRLVRLLYHQTWFIYDGIGSNYNNAEDKASTGGTW